MQVDKLISGGQTGVDQIGLEVARSLGIPTGGTAPKGYKTETGPNLELIAFGLVESHSASYPVRTRQNVLDSDGTVVFGDPESGGTKLTIQTAHQLRKPVLVNPTAFEFREWLLNLEIRVLNVAGSRESKLTEVQSERTRQTLRQALEFRYKDLSKFRTLLQATDTYCRISHNN
ncbi:YpsA SLOG family protein [Larkinella sp. GY13]|uniref:YpsA SLOG family protein n=1 Tax=Larkinella sp. GY13 TaxID=3453720 RepID=UPI003EEC9B93